MATYDLKNFAVIDYGADTFRAGCAVDYPADTVQEPRLVRPCVVKDKDAGTVVRPVVNGEIVDMDAFECLLHQALYGTLGWEAGNEGNVVMTEPVLVRRTEREQLTQLMFEVFNVTGYFVQDQASLSLCAVGKAAGTVVDIGHEKADVSLVSEGILLPATACRLPRLGCAALCKRFKSLMGDALQACDEEAQMEAFIRAANCQSETGPSAEETELALPDGQKITLKGEGEQAVEALFQPSLIGETGPSLVDAVFGVINVAPDAAARRAAYEGILCCGGGSSIPGLNARFFQEVNSQSPASIAPLMLNRPDYMPENSVRFSAWSGAAIVAKGLLQYGHMMTKQDYEERGPAGMHARCS